MSPTIKLEDGISQRESSLAVKGHRLASSATLQAAKDVPSPSAASDDNKKVSAPKLSPEQVYRLLPDAWLTARKLRHVNENEVAKKVCFGMITDLPFKAFNEAFNLQTLSETNVKLDAENRLFRSNNGHDHELGEFQPRAAEILRVLSAEHSLSLQLFTRVSQNRISWMTKGSKRKRETQVIVAIWVIIYGPMDLAQAVGDFAAECGINLQDPIYPVHNVIYKNPHLLAVPGEETATTSSFARQYVTSRVEALSSEQFNGIWTNGNLRPDHPGLPETEAPSEITTALCCHQKQGLTFFLRRERGWLLDGPEKDVWSRRIEANRRNIYINNITGQHQTTAPPAFRGGLLADGMGLGKTLQLIALIALNPVRDSVQPAPELSSASVRSTKTTLIVVPPSLLPSWIEQLERHVKPRTLSWTPFHGKRRPNIDEVLDKDILITTLQTMVSEWKKEQKANTDFRTKATLYSVNWHRIILDEAHCIRQTTTWAARAACAIRANHKWAVTATPIQSRLTDLASIFKFLGVYPFSDPKVFQSEIVSPWLRNDPAAYTRLESLIGAVVICRTRATLSLPRRTDEIHCLDFSAAERRFYGATMTRVIPVLEEAISSSVAAGSSQYFCVLQYLNKLRLICNHGLLTRKTVSVDSEVDESNIWNSGTAQEAFELVLHAGAAICTDCGEDIGARIQEGHVPQCRISKCQEILCNECVTKRTNTFGDAFCSHDPPCPSHKVSLPDVDLTLSVNSPESPLGRLNPTAIPTKVRALVDSIEKLGKGQKSVVCSYWNFTLDIIASVFNERSISYTRVDGKLNIGRRQKAIYVFQNEPTTQVLLLSITLSGAGLNLTAASRAYVMEPQWNPMVEEQFFSRLHRMGQTQDVTTIRYVMRNSVEEKILERNNQTKDLPSLASGKESSKSEADVRRLKVGIPCKKEAFYVHHTDRR